MVKGMFVVTRVPSMSHDEFVKYWRDVHAPIAKQMPGLRRYKINPASGGADGGEAPFDGIAELSFDDQAAYEAGFGSPEGQATMEDAAKFIDMSKIRAVVTEEISIV
jgi:uncharacterized protein (TIGR02118 family)